MNLMTNCQIINYYKLSIFMTENTALNMLTIDEYHLTFHVLSVLDERLEFLDLQF